MASQYKHLSKRPTSLPTTGPPIFPSPHSSLSKSIGFSALITIQRPLNGRSLELQIFVQGKANTFLLQTAHTLTKF
jgi:hypothetical protein